MRKFYPLFFILFSFAVYAQEITLNPIASGFSAPVNIQHAGDDRLFIVEKGGIIKVLHSDGTINPTPYLDISGQISSGGERGLLGLAFHPDYANNGFFFVFYTQPNGNLQISRFSVDGDDANIADPTSELQLLNVEHVNSNHNGGCIAFGPDGNLFISTGDGGIQGDPTNLAQNTTQLLGKLLRIDVDNPGAGLNYGIPADNPFAGSSIDAEEIWAYGLRNPWKFSFDSSNGDLWLADVGYNTIEEINHVQSSEGGLNYGWRCYEGSQIYNNTDCPDPSELTFPVAEYTHATGNSITGGYVYRGSTFDFEGYYFFADFGTGIIGTVDADDNLTILQNFPNNWSSFGEDVHRELYIADYGGTIYRIEGVLANESFSKDDFKLFPNPAYSNVTIINTTSGIQNVVIRNLQGAKVFETRGNSETKVDVFVDHMASGMYFVTVSNVEGSSLTKKLIIK